MAVKKGNLSIDSENIFPIIKKWVYSDHDIFVRELISNGCDAITKLKKLDMMGEYEMPDDYKANIQVIVNPEEKTIKFIDNGLGMTADEVVEYITQIAFSGATQFLEKYKDKTTEDEMIGHFGLGFYSAFMVAEEVQIDTLSYQEGATPVNWRSDGGTEYEIQDGSKDCVGTEITLYLNENSLEFANEYRVREVLQKYCSFMPVEIFLTKEGAEVQYETIDESEVLDSDEVIERFVEEPKPIQVGEDGKIDEEDVVVEEPKQKAKIVKRPVPINDIRPLWGKAPSECTKEEYLDFYRKVFMDYKEPLFWIHLNMDYPFNLKGILYFPKVNTQYDSLEGVIKLYNNQVFIADNIKEVIPEFLTVLKGVIDCPDLPLNVSRSALQNDGFVGKVADYIARKIADKINGMYKTDKENYEKRWEDISPFIKYGSLRDEKFGERVRDSILFKDLDGIYMNLEECIQVAKGEKLKDEIADDETEVDGSADEATDDETEVDGNDDEATDGEAEVDESTDEVANDEMKVDEAVEDVDEEDRDEEDELEEKDETINIFYVTDTVQQSQYIKMFKEQGQDAILLTHPIDNAFITYLEQHNEGVRFQRIDADLHDSLKDDVAEDEKKDFKKTSDRLMKIFRRELGNENLEVKVEKIKDENVSSMMVLPEHSRRMEEMMKMYSMGDLGAGMMGMGSTGTLILNVNHPLVKYVEEHKKGKTVSLICKQLYDVALLAHKPLSPEEMTEFVKRNNQVMMLLTKMK